MVSSSNLNSALIIASDIGHKDEVLNLLNKGANVNTKTYSGKTPLMVTSDKGHKEIVKALLENGADVNANDKNGYTALMFASKNGHGEIVQILLEKGADANAKNLVGLTALFLSSQNGYAEIVQTLLNEGADINVKKNSGDAISMEASQKVRADNGTDKGLLKARYYASRHRQSPLILTTVLLTSFIVSVIVTIIVEQKSMRGINTIDLIFLITAFIYFGRLSAIKQLKAEQVPNILPEKFSKWQALKVEGIWSVLKVYFFWIPIRLKLDEGMIIASLPGHREGQPEFLLLLFVLYFGYLFYKVASDLFGWKLSEIGYEHLFKKIETESKEDAIELIVQAPLDKGANVNGSVLVTCPNCGNAETVARHCSYNPKSFVKFSANDRFGFIALAFLRMTCKKCGHKFDFDPRNLA